MSEKDEFDQEGETIVKNKLRPPSKYKVLLHNDDYTTMEFVIEVLRDFFNKTEEESHQIMLKVHNEGVGVCGIYTFEVAETKIQQVMEAAEKEGHPLKCSYEKE